MRRYLFVFLVASFALAGCEGARNNASWSDQKEGAEVVPVIKEAASADTSAAHADSADTSQTEH